MLALLVGQASQLDHQQKLELAQKKLRRACGGNRACSRCGWFYLRTRTSSCRWCLAARSLDKPASSSSCSLSRFLRCTSLVTTKGWAKIKSYLRHLNEPTQHGFLLVKRQSLQRQEQLLAPKHLRIADYLVDQVKTSDVRFRVKSYPWSQVLKQRLDQLSRCALLKRKL